MNNIVIFEYGERSVDVHLKDETHTAQSVRISYRFKRKATERLKESASTTTWTPLSRWLPDQFPSGHPVKQYLALWWRRASQNQKELMVRFVEHFVLLKNSANTGGE